MHSFKPIFAVVMDSVGIGEEPDAHNFNDVGADTLKHIAQHMKGLQMANIESCSHVNIRELEGTRRLAILKIFSTKSKL